MKRIYMVFLILPFLLCGCSRTTDMEDRNYAMVMGIDLDGEELLVSYSFADIGKMADGSGKRPQSKSLFLSGPTLKQVEEDYRSFQDKKLELGHLKAILLGNTLCQDIVKKQEVLAEIEAGRKYGNTVLIYETKEQAKALIQLDHKIQGLLGDYLNDMFYNNQQRNNEEPVTIQNVLEAMNEKKAVTIPVLTIRDKKPAITGNTIWKDWKGEGPD